MAGHVPAIAQAYESVGRHELHIGQDFPADHQGQPGPADQPLVCTAHGRRLGVFQDAAPTRQDFAALMQRSLARMQADHRSGRRPQSLHGVDIPVVERPIEGAIGCQNGFAFFFVEFRQ